jgi:SAM-dependent methyltransferase
MVMPPPEFSETIENAARLVGYRNGARFRFRGNFVFDGVPLSDARVLEVGCGSGAWAIWAALNGASKVVGVEPEAEGSSDHSLERLRQNIQTLGLQTRVETHGCTLQELPSLGEGFDVIVLYNVINHLDEDSVIALHNDPAAKARYVELLRKLRLHVNPNGWVIVADCGRDNLWPRLGLNSPLARSIEWHKHQNPPTWINVFAQAGFEFFDLRWSPLQPLPLLTGNSWVQYLTCSHFVLRFRVGRHSCSGEAVKPFTVTEPGLQNTASLRQLAPKPGELLFTSDLMKF